MNDMGHDSFYTCAICGDRHKSDVELTLCAACAEGECDWSEWLPSPCAKALDNETNIC